LPIQFRAEAGVGLVGAGVEAVAWAEAVVEAGDGLVLALAGDILIIELLMLIRTTEGPL